MKNSKILFDDFIKEITLPESRDEITALAYLVFEAQFDLSRTDILLGKSIPADAFTTSKLSQIAQRINDHEPVQYILGKSLFYGRYFFVNPSVLIPRPETEELVHLILSTHAKDERQLNILDIGTGSGCIPITLNLEHKHAKVSAIDISDQALATARRNAEWLNAVVNFMQCDILHEQPVLSDLDIVVSNPPYIAYEEKSAMHSNVVDHEPHLALFVDDKNPLLFYDVITDKSKLMLKTNGSLWFEINERFGKEVAQCMQRAGFVDVNIHKDASGKDRFVSGLFIDPQQ
ncbi:peptide chain release factor N(5)-glutamine methyltransferase [Pseudochryseolinea flava]|uniref:peptide chain release factor N(5)-glutamine methyltransferase n=1 Tax=Pseudochryseolinea flava TaxID=2059302 RepID=A0A364Y6N9_9BACT|nr:peptide chain release factor N(5)-glutamine methyltransferase [Pseudochryseolinea flava]RAW02764.1 peptide chain release factor N(5)-glutamine methyltransferase [Pseudochryseolinea flava]